MTTKTFDTLSWDAKHSKSQQSLVFVEHTYSIEFVADYSSKLETTRKTTSILVNINGYVEALN